MYTHIICLLILTKTADGTQNALCFCFLRTIRWSNHKKILTNFKKNDINITMDRGAAAKSTLQRGHPQKQLKGKAAEIYTEASVYIGAMDNTMCTPVYKTEELSET